MVRLRILCISLPVFLCIQIIDAQTIEFGAGMNCTKYISVASHDGSADANFKSGLSLDFRLMNWRKQQSKGAFILQFHKFQGHANEYYYHNGYEEKINLDIMRNQISFGFLPLNILPKSTQVEMRLGYMFMVVISNRTSGTKEITIQRPPPSYRKIDIQSDNEKFNSSMGAGIVGSLSYRILTHKKFRLKARCTGYLSPFSEISLIVSGFLPIRTTLDVALSIPIHNNKL